MTDLKKVCFFCNKDIKDKKSFEHIIPDGLLGKMGIKEAKVTGDRVTQYSRIKVPAHSRCNNEFGSRYEEIVLELLQDTDTLYQAIVDEEGGLPIEYGPSASVSSIMTTWLSKIYYGMFYDDYLKTSNENWKEICLHVIESQNFDLVRKSYEGGYGFQLPSSLFVFQSKNSRFDLFTSVNPSTILIKINTITLVLCLCDGYLTKGYLNGETLQQLRDRVTEENLNDSEFPSHKLALSEILALRLCIPKSPSFIYGNHQILNMSFSTMVSNPSEVYKIDVALLKELRIKFLSEFGIQLLN